jgi:uncharacterized protein (TIGR03067 family)
MRCFLPFFALVSVAFAPAPEPTPAQQDLKRMQGAWVLVYAVTNGLRENQTQEAVWLIEGNRVSTTLDGKKGATFYIALDSKIKPRALDILSSEKGTPKTLGRYSLDGDTLKVCLGEKRPPDLSGNDPSRGVWVFNRKKR